MQPTDELDSYNRDTEHDMWVNKDNFENSGNPDVLDKTVLDNFIETLNDWN